MADTTKQEEKWEENVNNSELEVIDLDGDDDEIKDDPVFDEKAYNSVKNLVARKTTQADNLKNDIKELNESLKNIQINDSQLSEAEEEVKKLKILVTKRKKELMESAEGRDIRLKLNEKKEELKDIEESLSNQLLNLYQITGVKEFETSEGEVREFVIRAKVKAGKK